MQPRQKLPASSFRSFYLTVFPAQGSAYSPLGRTIQKLLQLFFFWMPQMGTALEPLEKGTGCLGAGASEQHTTEKDIRAASAAIIINLNCFMSLIVFKRVNTMWFFSFSVQIVPSMRRKKVLPAVFASVNPWWVGRFIIIQYIVKGPH